MQAMEFLGPNLLNTTTMAAVDSGTDTTEFLFDNGTRMGWETVGRPDGNSAKVTVTLPSNTVITHILMRDHNFKTVYVYLNQETTTSRIVFDQTNSYTSTYIAMASVTVNAVIISGTDTIVPNEEKRIGELIIAEREVQFERNPASSDYDPVLTRKQILHEMPDGGTVAYNIKEKFQAKLKWKFATDSFRDSLLSVYLAAKPVTFVPFPTTTGWAGAAYECIWASKWDWTYSSNVKEGGWEGSIDLRETPGG